MFSDELRLGAVDDFTGDNGGDGATFEGLAIEGGVAGLAGGVGDGVGPGTIQRKDGEVQRTAFIFFFYLWIC